MRTSSPHASARRKLAPTTLTCVERMQAVNGASPTVDDILAEIFPFQSSYCRAEKLVAPPLLSQHIPYAPRRVATRVRSRRLHETKQQRGISASTPLAAIERPLSPLRVAPGAPLKSPLPALTSKIRKSVATHDQAERHAMTLWDDKFQTRSLSPQDVLYLLTHEDILRVLESASVLRVARLSYDQLMELEVALESTRRPRSDTFECVYPLLCDSVWQRGIAFQADQAPVGVQTACGCVGLRKRVLAPLRSPSSWSPRAMAAASTATSSAKSRPIERAPSCTVLAASVMAAPMKSQQRYVQTALPYNRASVERPHVQLSSLHERRLGERELQSCVRREHHERLHRQIGADGSQW